MMVNGTVAASPGVVWWMRKLIVLLPAENTTPTLPGDPTRLPTSIEALLAWPKTICCAGAARLPPDTTTANTPACTRLTETLHGERGWHGSATNDVASTRLPTDPLKPPTWM